MSFTVLGIPNCDSVKKARVFLQSREVDFVFRDLRKEPLSAEEWRALVDQDEHGVLINTRSPTFRKTGVAKDTLSDPQVCVDLLLQAPTAMKRPAVLKDGQLKTVGFNEATLSELLES